MLDLFVLCKKKNWENRENSIQYFIKTKWRSLLLNRYLRNRSTTYYYRLFSKHILLMCSKLSRWVSCLPFEQLVGLSGQFSIIASRRRSGRCCSCCRRRRFTVLRDTFWAARNLKLAIVNGAFFLRKIFLFFMLSRVLLALCCSVLNVFPLTETQQPEVENVVDLSNLNNAEQSTNCNCRLAQLKFSKNALTLRTRQGYDWPFFKVNLWRICIVLEFFARVLTVARWRDYEWEALYYEFCFVTFIPLYLEKKIHSLNPCFYSQLICCPTWNEMKCYGHVFSLLWPVHIKHKLPNFRIVWQILLLFGLCFVATSHCKTVSLDNEAFKTFFTPSYVQDQE